VSVTRITEHFTWQEFACRTEEPVPVELQPQVRRLCASLELIRARLGGPLVVVCGYRTPAYNQSLRDLAERQGRISGVAVDSQHTKGTAADVKPADLDDLPRLKHTVEWMIEHGELPEVGGYGTYAGWIHVDVRDKPHGHVARWVGAGAGTDR
jgi:uncharacterized protein YcbK (DUF882 family)